MRYKIQTSSDGTKKLIFDQGHIAVIIPTKDEKNTVCISCQVGCPVGCKFCSTGKLGFKGNLSAEEIFEQAKIAQELIGKKIQSIVFMGMGEPTLNLKNVLEAAEKMHKELLISYNRITISTSCLSNLGLLEDIPFNVALSLHSSFDKTRKELIPGAASLRKILLFTRKYLKKSNNKKYVMVAYSMIRGVNDSEKDLQKLISLKWPKKMLFNLIEFNPAGDFKKSDEKVAEHFKEEIIKAGWKCFIRKSRGSDIEAACGMLDY
jgi:23S rRNA (adenine2503-C2)-methyltransferase